MPRSGPVFQDHHNIEQQTLKNSRLLGTLSEAGLFDIHAQENRIFLPSDPRLANALGITPHSGGPIGDYQLGTRMQLLDLEQSADGRAAIAGDPDAMERMVARVAQMRDTIKAGLVNGDLHTNAPAGLTSADIRPRVQSFFGGLENYGQLHSLQIDGFRTLPQTELGWASIAHSESRVVSTLQYTTQASNNLIRGGDADLGRHSLSQAIADAHGAGRLTLSEQSIRQVENALGSEAAAPLRIPPGQRGFASMELLAGELSTSTLIRSGGLLATGADLTMSAQRAAELSEQGNMRAAQSEVNHALARNAGGWIGGATAAYAVGASGFIPATVVAGDALLMSKAFDKAVDLVDNHGIYNQIDKQGVAWKFTGRNWERAGAIDNTQDGVSNPVESRIGATYEKSRELGYYATAASVELALGKAPAPQDPFDIPAQARDQVGLDNQNWHRDPNSEQWVRQIRTGVEGANDRGVYREEIASPERAVELNREAIGRIELNIAQGREAIASAYVANYAAQRSQDFGPVPAAVQSALPKSDVVRGSDEHIYHRSPEGVWLSNGQPAQGNVALELDLTSQARQPSMERNARAMADLEARPAPAPEQMQQNELLHRYRIAGVELLPEWQQAIEIASQRTRAEHGLTGLGSVQLLRNEQGQIAADSPIAHYRRGADGVDHLVTTTNSQDIKAALGEVQGRTLAQQEGITTLATVPAVAPPGMRRRGDQEPEEAEPAPEPRPKLADDPSHPDFDTFDRIHQWVRGTGQWDEEKGRNVAAALYKEQAADPLVQRVDMVTGALGRDGAENVFAVYAPFGDKAPYFHAHVDGREASQQPAQQNLEQAEQIKQQQALDLQMQQTLQQNNPAHHGPKLSM